MPFYLKGKKKKKEKKFCNSVEYVFESISKYIILISSRLPGPVNKVRLKCPEPDVK